ncbi:enoyl-CoA hydratase/isomerase family protein [Mycobacterium xenopi 4042]|uniref:Enoyl-CoA hydratase/isomerase family protein n=1 Tax=Mycobacterium xenopi 4042 TaxID=1299334 RepID=X8AH66_MYCXE|nr:enoyl-CoA hydratase/isomerase family protein [Mycobacterium xenopi 4042]
MPAEIDVQADGPLRIITLNRPDALNAVNDSLHTGLAQLWPRLSDDRSARAAVLTGSGRAFSAGGDFHYLAELSQDADLRAKTIAHGREIVLGMARCRVPVIAAVNGPLSGWVAAWWRCPTSSTSPRRPISPTRTCRSGWSRPMAARSPGRCTSVCC